MSESDLVSVEVQQTDAPPVAVIRVSGELDYSTTPRLVEAIARLPRPGQHMIFDLSELRFCDSSGLGAMIAAYKTTAAGGGNLYVTGAHPAVMTAITITSLDQIFRIRDDVASALSEIGPA
jgi:anti-sigma B factor antagonist